MILGVKKGRSPRAGVELTIRLPKQLYLLLEPLALADARYVTNWIVLTLERVLKLYDHTQPVVTPLLRKRINRYHDAQIHRLTLSMTVELRQALTAVATRERTNSNELITMILEKVASSSGG